MRDGSSPMYILEETMTTILIIVVISSEAVAITDIAGYSNRLYITKSKDLNPRFNCSLVGSGLEPSP